MRRDIPNQTNFLDFYIPFSGQLDVDNRWVKLADQIDWTLVDECYDESLSIEQGAPSKSARLAFGALIVKEKLSLSDRGTEQLVSENPYLQYFLGASEFRSQSMFDASMMVHFRKRFSEESLQRINESIAGVSANDSDDDPDQKNVSDDNTPSNIIDEGAKNEGTLLMDATCVPSDITFPTDLKLLNDAREKTEQMIDLLHAPLRGVHKKPRSYRLKARKDYLEVAKKKKVAKRILRKAIRKQLQYVSRNLRSIDQLVDEQGQSLSLLPQSLYRKLLVIQELYRQQNYMYHEKTHSVADRIVSIIQPWVRPIVRGKAGKSTEFGAKISVALVNGYSFVDRLSWDAYNESVDLEKHAEEYHRRFGFYPKRICADQLYRTKSNRQWCQNKGIRLSGLRPGRPSKDTSIRRQELEQLRQDEKDRNAIEGKFGQGKRRYGLNLNTSKLVSTGIATILMSFVVMNLAKRVSLSHVFSFFLQLSSYVSVQLLELRRNSWAFLQISKFLRI